VQTAGKRVAVIGSGSTGVQLVSALQPEVAHIDHFVRTPQWVIWSPIHLRQASAMDKLLGSFPWLNRRLHSAMLLTEDFLTDLFIRPSWRRRLFEQFAWWTLRRQVRDPELRARLTPTYRPMCKRQVFSRSYYPAIQSPNAEFITEPIQEITHSGIRTADGKFHDVDVIVLATGFHPHNYMRPMNLVGRAGTSIDDVWAKGPKAYRMTAIPGFPNLFTVMGPNSSTGSISPLHASELTARYIAQWLKRFRAGEFDTVEVTEAATTRFNDDVAESLGPTVWNTGCNSWYLTDEGEIDLWPFDRKTMAEMLAEPDLRDFVVR
jgi:cation diffusion facilitator CzcD-associated flavoprotein CzcO